MKRKHEIGIVFGRFQPFHNGHSAHIVAALEQCDLLYIGISNPDPKLTAHEITDINRSHPSNNPLYFFERLEMVRSVLLSKGINNEQFRIVPFPINFPELTRYYVPDNGVVFLSIFDDWGWEKKLKLESHNFKVIITENGKPSDKLASGSLIRDFISLNLPWQHLVPNLTYNYILNNNIDIRIKSLYDSSESNHLRWIRD